MGDVFEAEQTFEAVAEHLQAFDGHAAGFEVDVGDAGGGAGVGEPAVAVAFAVEADEVAALDVLEAGEGGDQGEDLEIAGGT